LAQLSEAPRKSTPRRCPSWRIWSPHTILCGYVASSSQPLPTSFFELVLALWAWLQKVPRLGFTDDAAVLTAVFSLASHITPVHRAAGARALGKEFPKRQ